MRLLHSTSYTDCPSIINNEINRCLRCPDNGLYKYCPIYKNMWKEQKGDCGGKGGWGSCPAKELKVDEGKEANARGKRI